MLSKFGSEQDQKNIEQSIVYLQNQQFSENVGFLLNLLGMEDGDLGLIKNQALEVLSDLAHTRRVLESLSNAASITPQIRKSSIIFK